MDAHSRLGLCENRNTIDAQIVSFPEKAVCTGGGIRVIIEAQRRSHMERYRWKTAVVTLSDKGYRREREDKSAPLIQELLSAEDYDVAAKILLPDEQVMIERELIRLCDEEHMDLILTTVRRKLHFAWRTGMRPVSPMPCVIFPFRSRPGQCSAAVCRSSGGKP